MTSKRNSQKVQMMFWYNYLLERHWLFHCTQTCRYDTILWAVSQPYAEGLSFNYKASDAKYFDLIFVSAELRSAQYLLLRWCSHYVQAFHITRYHYLGQFFIHVCRLDTCHNTWKSFCVRCWISHPVFSVFHYYCQRLKYTLLLLQFEIFSAFTLQGITSSRLLPSMYWSD